MLKALYDYGIKNGLSISPGFTPKAISAYIVLSGKGDFLGIEQQKDETQICPDIGSLANSPDKCNPLAEKTEIILAVPSEKTPDEASDEKEAQKIKKQQNNLVKKKFYSELLKSSSEYSPSHAICLNALEDPEIFSAIREEASRKKLKAMDRISFRVDNEPITSAAGVNDWWSEYRKRFTKSDKKNNADSVLCLITGKPTEPLSTLPTVNGLQRVGGHSRGEALFCFDKSAFQSYGLKQSANAPVSDEAFSVVKDALNDLLKGSPAMYDRDPEREFNPIAPAFAGMKFVHWYDKKIRYEDDRLAMTVGDDDDFGGNDDDDEEEIADDKFLANDAKKKADDILDGIHTGDKSLPLPYEYHIMLISGANGRAMIRRYEHGSYETLQKNLDLWYDDLLLCDNLGTGTVRSKKLFFRLTRLMYPQKSDKSISDRMKKELSGLTPYIIMAITNGTMLPDAVASRSLEYINSKMISPDENDKFWYMPDAVACQWLKVWANRKRRSRNEEVLLMPDYDSKFPDAAYHCGAIMAIYADIQNTAMKDVNAGIVQRYYASASRTPTLVLGVLERMSKYHLDKIDKGWLVKKYEKYLNEAYSFFGATGERRLPSALNLEEQSYFALGYRQMSARLVADRNEHSAENKKQNKNVEEDA